MTGYVTGASMLNISASYDILDIVCLTIYGILMI